MGPGLALAVLGAILALAVTREVPGLDMDVLGLILFAAGVLVMVYAHRREGTEKVVTHVEKSDDPSMPTHIRSTRSVERDAR